MFQRMLPTIAVIGLKKSGKTALIRRLIAELRSRGYSVMSAKHVASEGFTIDTEDTDTWWHSKAGANPVVCVSNLETAVIYKTAQSDFSLGKLFEYALKGTDLILLEGFSKWTLKDESVAKVIMAKSKLDYKEFLRDSVGQVLCVCSFSPPSKPDITTEVLDLERDLDAVVKRIIDFVEEEKKTYAILNQLPGLNCRKCGYESCLDLARAIRSEKASEENCTPISLKSKLRSRVVLDEQEIPLQAFVSKIIHATILAMLSSLKGTEIKGDEFVEVKVSTHH